MYDLQAVYSFLGLQRINCDAVFSVEREYYILESSVGTDKPSTSENEDQLEFSNSSERTKIDHFRLQFQYVCLSAGF